MRFVYQNRYLVFFCFNDKKTKVMHLLFWELQSLELWDNRKRQYALLAHVMHKVNSLGPRLLVTRIYRDDDPLDFLNQFEDLFL